MSTSKIWVSEDIAGRLYYGYEAEGFSWVTETDQDSGRWTEYGVTVLEKQGEFWGLSWERPLTEMQDCDLFPDKKKEQVPLVKLSRKEVVTYEYVPVKVEEASDG